MASSCVLCYASMQNELESKVLLNCAKAFSLKENLQNCSRDDAATQECKK